MPQIGEALIRRAFSTADLRPGDQYEAWRSWFAPLLTVCPKQSVAGGFRAEQRAFKVGDLTISQVSAPAVRVIRSKRDVRRDSVDHWVLTYCKRGTTRMHTVRESLEAPPGVPFLWSLGVESESERTDVERVQLFLPRDSLRDISPLLDAASGSLIDTTLGHLLGDYLVSLDRVLPRVAPADLDRLSAMIRAMVGACVVPSPERLALAGSQINLGRMERVRQAVRKHLYAPGLGPATLCRAVGISRSNLYRLFDGTGGVARYVQSQRLLEAHARLCNVAASQPIADIAEALCFADASSFSRAFRREFGRSPGDVRAAAQAGLPTAALTRMESRSDADNFGQLLRGS